LNLYTRDILNDEFGALPNVPESQIRRTAQLVGDMVIREFEAFRRGVTDFVKPIPVCPDCHATMTKETDEDVDGVMLVHWCCECEWEGANLPTDPPDPVVSLVCSRCGERRPRPDHCHVVLCPVCGHRMSLRLERPGMGDAGMMVRVSVPEDNN